MTDLRQGARGCMNDERTCTQSGAKLTHDVPEVFSGWQPIETAPKDGTQILCWWSKSKVYEVLDWCEGRWTNLDGDDITPPSVWMPLPEPPK